MTVFFLCPGFSQRNYLIPAALQCDHLGKPGMQYVLKSSRAFERIVFTGFEKVLSEVWYEKKMIRDTTARNEYLNAERYRRQRGDLFIVQILDEEIKPDDSRLR